MENNNAVDNKEVESRIVAALEKVRSSLQADGGDVGFVSWDESTGVVGVRLQGMCVGCPMSQITLKEGIERALKEAVPEVKEVVHA